jgi:NADPH:quinone reductase-like Zn-dependent oxidoreductase
MKAIIWTNYGSPEGLVMGDVKKPVPGEDMILIKIHASSVTAGDCEIRRLELPLMLSLPFRLYVGWKAPKRIKILGQELAGEIVSVGKNVSKFKVGDSVFGTTGMGFGAYGEYICLPESPGETGGVLAIMPKNLSYEEAAILPTAGMEALHYFNKAGLERGQKVLIIGAGGSIGSIALQLAKSRGAKVTAVDRKEKQAFLCELGADHVIDFMAEDYTKSANSYDLIIDVVGKKSVGKRMRLLTKGGSYFLAYAGIRHVFLGILTGLFFNRKLIIQSSEQTQKDLNDLKRMVEDGKLKPIIDKAFPLSQIFEAHRYSESGNKRGNIVITLL